MDENFKEKILSNFKINKKDRLTIKPKNIKTQQNLFYHKKEHLEEFIKQRLLSLQDYFKEHLNVKEFKPANSICINSDYFYGMIINYENSKLSKDNIMIYNNIDDSNCVPVKLDITFLKNFSFFPGQVLAIKGKNVEGCNLVAENVFYLTEIDFNAVEKSVDTSDPLKIISCSGPFYDDINGFEVLDALLLQKVDLLILHGPLLKFDFNKTVIDPIKFYENEFIVKLESWLKKDTFSKIILIPSLDDFICKNVLPQSQYDLFSKNKRIIYFSNPANFFVNGFLFSTISSDIFMDLSAEEFFSINLQKKIKKDEGVDEKKEREQNQFLFTVDRPTRLCSHLIFQQTFLPVFPTKFNVSFSDCEYFKNQLVPNFFILSSKLQPFSKDVYFTKIINHGIQSNIEYKYFAKIIIKDENDYVVNLTKLIK
ncbi:DNA polymerase alpha subunit B [Tubulinosema ratisbonensis]|uniref:DNA polymerase alpha subunit B n=1 Tax=Tubulinosema ratisbonensis TaxID=291195 RepID=A0A437AKX7_9MICR|nr:DNA polymerase alpha subunit B [Tubulinosema ratisbonensis]